MCEITDAHELAHLRNKPVRGPNGEDVDVQALTYFVIADRRHKHAHDRYCAPHAVFLDLQGEWLLCVRGVAQTWPASLLLSIVSASHLRPLDANGLSDPYCSAYFVGGADQRLGGTRCFVAKLLTHADPVYTQVRSKTLCPNWGRQNFALYAFYKRSCTNSCISEVPDQAGFLVIECYDHDRFGRDDKEGELVLALRGVSFFNACPFHTR